MPETIIHRPLSPSPSSRRWPPCYSQCLPFYRNPSSYHHTVHALPPRPPPPPPPRPSTIPLRLRSPLRKMLFLGKPRLCLVLVTISTVPFLLLLLLLKARVPMPVLLSRDSLTVLTLIYGQPFEHRNIAHNCAMISRTRHKYIVYTDKPSEPYCSVCECRLFTKENCPCPDEINGCAKKNPCEKLGFLIRALQQFEEFVFLDNDLLILKDDFLDHLSKRALAHDFLASYGHRFVDSFSYTRHFNSGLLFIRRLPGVDYEEMREMLYERKTQQDQGIVSMFVQERYRNWDVLSWKWHCRMLGRMSQDIPPGDCYTIHDKNEVEEVLRLLNRTRLTIPATGR